MRLLSISSAETGSSNLHSGEYRVKTSPIVEAAIDDKEDAEKSSMPPTMP